MRWLPMDKVTGWMDSGWNSSQREWGGRMPKHISEQELCVVKQEEATVLQQVFDTPICFKGLYLN